MKYLSEYLVALALGFGTLVLASMDVHAAVVCGLNGCHHYYPHRSQWPVGGAQRTGGTIPPHTAAQPSSAARDFAAAKRDTVY